MICANEGVVLSRADEGVDIIEAASDDRVDTIVAINATVTGQRDSVVAAEGAEVERIHAALPVECARVNNTFDKDKFVCAAATE